MVNKCAECGKFVSHNTSLVICTSCSNSAHQNCIKTKHANDSDWRCNKCLKMTGKTDMMTKLDEICMKLGKLDSIEATVKNTDQRLAEAVKKIEAHEEKIQNIVTEMEEVKRENARLRKLVNDNKQHDQNKNIKIHNYPETKDESTDEIIKKVAMAIGVKLEDGALLNSHRMGGKAEQGKPPPIIIAAFNSSRVADSFIYNKKKRELKMRQIDQQARTPEQQIYINANLTKSNRDLYIKTKAKCKAVKYERFWQSKGRIKCRKLENSSVISINTEEDLQKIV